LLFHITFLFVALLGKTVATKVWLPPGERLTALVLRLTPLTGTSVALTLTAQAAVLPPSSVVTVIVAVPAATALTTPSVTVAIEGALVSQVTLLFVALAGVKMATRVWLPPTARLIEVLLKETEATGISVGLTLTAQVAVLPPLSVVTVMVALPAATALTTPFVTVAIEGALLLHVTLVFFAVDGVTVAVKTASPPTIRLRVGVSSFTPVTAPGLFPLGFSRSQLELRSIAKTSAVKRNLFLLLILISSYRYKVMLFILRQNVKFVRGMVPDTSAMKRRAKRFHHEPHEQTRTTD
jgi:hypothetical protein